MTEIKIITKSRQVKWWEIIQEYSGPYLVIGDRKQDLECARSCKSLFVGCLYGYGEEGELDRADYLVENIEEILTKAGI